MSSLPNRRGGNASTRLDCSCGPGHRGSLPCSCCGFFALVGGNKDAWMLHVGFGYHVAFLLSLADNIIVHICIASMLH